MSHNKKKLSYKEDYDTKHNVFDEFTNRTLYKLITEGYFEGLESPLAIGKESNVFTALKKDGTRVVVKIYRLETCDFNRMYDYIKGDPRYLNIKKRKRNVIFSWVQREYRNLMLARESGVHVPLPYTFMNNILVLECVGIGDSIAPKLKSQTPKDPKKFFDEVLLNMKKLYKGGLVHGDLSPFNILNKGEQVVFIDFSQATQTDHANIEDYLVRDIKNICKYFQGLGVDANEMELRKHITGKAPPSVPQ